MRDFQDERYARLYDERVNRIRALDAGNHRLTRETARFLALWMSYEDIVRVADLKSRRSRLARVRDDVRAMEDYAAAQRERLVEAADDHHAFWARLSETTPRSSW